MSNPHGSFIWYELMTPDPAASKAFYDDVVGWTIDAQSASPMMDYRMITAPDGHVGGVFKLDEGMIAAGARPKWVGYIGVDDADAAFAKAKDLGAHAFVPPTDIPDVGRFALLADPQGAPFYIMRAFSDESSTAFDEKAMGHVAWNELATSDQAAALAFFGALAKWESKEAMPMGEMGEYRFIDLDDRRLGAVMTRQPEGPPPAWTFYFRVDDVQAATDRVVGGGGTVLHGPVEVPGGDWIIVASDPHGATFGLVGPNENDVE